MPRTSPLPPLLQLPPAVMKPHTPRLPPNHLAFLSSGSDVIQTIYTGFLTTPILTPFSRSSDDVLAIPNNAQGLSIRPCENLTVQNKRAGSERAGDLGEQPQRLARA